MTVGGEGKGWVQEKDRKFCKNVEQRITPTVFDMEQGLLPVCDIVWEKLKPPEASKYWCEAGEERGIKL